MQLFYGKIEYRFLWLLRLDAKFIGAPKEVPEELRREENEEKNEEKNEKAFPIFWIFQICEEVRWDMDIVMRRQAGPPSFRV